MHKLNIGDRVILRCGEKWYFDKEYRVITSITIEKDGFELYGLDGFTEVWSNDDLTLYIENDVEEE